VRTGVGVIGLESQGLAESGNRAIEVAGTGFLLAGLVETVGFRILLLFRDGWDCEEKQKSMKDRKRRNRMGRGTGSPIIRQ
jgi:hypothetical protein